MKLNTVCSGFLVVFLAAACGGPGHQNDATAGNEAVQPTGREDSEAEPEVESDNGLLDVLLHSEDKSEEEIAGAFLKSIFKGMAEHNQKRYEANQRQQAIEDSLARIREAEEKAASDAARQAKEDSLAWWKRDFSITVERSDLLGAQWVTKRKGDRFYQIRKAQGIAAYYVYYNKEDHVGCYSTVNGSNDLKDKNIDVMLEAWLKENWVWRGYYWRNQYEKTGETGNYLDRDVEVWKNEDRTLWVDTETGAILYVLGNKSKAEIKYVKAFSTRVDVSDIASHLPDIQ